jgi:VRR-NUC domain
MRRRQQPEAALQRAIFQHVRLRLVPGAICFHVPNGGYRKPVEAAILKSMGTMPGIPDIVAIKDGRTYGLELKAPGGRLTDSQKAAHEQLRAAGAEVAVADNIDAALGLLEAWQILRGHTRLAST